MAALSSAMPSSATPLESSATPSTSSHLLSASRPPHPRVIHPSGCRSCYSPNFRPQQPAPLSA
ncbi:hypothetical protein M405DRAFT_807731, partial [Rhizopogon salebrosus TDB-379]